MTYLIVGLGNPGKEYAKTRHNFGFLVIDELIKQTGAQEVNTKLNADIWTTKINTATTLFMKPLTFMNESGRVVGPFIKTKKISPEQLIVIHDDLDIPFGEMRVKKNVSSAGHNGVQSVIDALGTQNFIRVRLGIGRPSNTMPTDVFVLARFSADEEKLISTITSQAIKKIEAILQS